jgi:hypothetical protein
MLRLLLTSVFLFLISGNSSPQNIINGNFEMGRNAGWIEQSQGGYTLIGTGDFFASTSIQPPVIPRSGSWMARVGGFGYEINATGQNVTLPNTTPLYLAFHVQTRSSETSECAGLYVGARVSIIVNNQELYYTYLCRYNDAHQWILSFIDLTPIAGQSALIVFKAESANSVWSYLYIDDVSLTNTVTSADEDQSSLYYELQQNYPNPFNPATTISFSLPAASFVSLKIYDLMGREVSEILSEELPAGHHEKVWDASGLSSGIYFYRLQAGSYSETKKLNLLK